MYAWIRANAADERKEKDTEEQFFYKSRKKAIGPFKKAAWDLPEAVRHEIGAALERKFEYLFGSSASRDEDTVVRFVKPVEVAASAATHGFVRTTAPGLRGARRPGPPADVSYLPYRARMAGIR